MGWPICWFCKGVDIEQCKVGTECCVVNDCGGFWNNWGIVFCDNCGDVTEAGNDCIDDDGVDSSDEESEHELVWKCRGGGKVGEEGVDVCAGGSWLSRVNDSLPSPSSVVFAVDPLVKSSGELGGVKYSFKWAPCILLITLVESKCFKE